jgi:phage recombination protein Bet
MSKALAIVESKAPSIVTEKDLDDWLFGTGTKLTEQQKALFYKVALSQNLNPIKKEIYAIPYGNNFNIVVGYETYLRRAEHTGLLEYWEATVDKDETGNWVGKCTIKRKDFSKAVTVEAWFSEYNQGTALWKSKPRTMIRKVAISQAFRMVFSEELGGLPYTSDEIVGDEIREVEFTPLDKMAEKVATDDLFARKEKALDFLRKKGKTWEDAETYLHIRMDKWEQSDLDDLKSWAKAGFPKPPDPAGEAIAPDLVIIDGKAYEMSVETISASQAGITEAQLASLRKVPADLLDDAFMETGVVMLDLVELDYSAAEALLAWLATQ